MTRSSAFLGSMIGRGMTRRRRTTQTAKEWCDLQTQVLTLYICHVFYGSPCFRS